MSTEALSFGDAAGKDQQAEGYAIEKLDDPADAKLPLP
eukprot:CAMPEP_0184532656 /NCGR_PEP_ID=MMETSP0198_2-20121128/14291_1 /TAXON_ID=1112570 /ORGANISM="Thraustochytrium sp., Strain LLF1b" /LENGTH=37 /DNA_ID= /DNA_START= /DNA_END= /DNA_ORIENTATION=